MNNYKMVSVIMCVYNTPQDYLNEAVLSVLNQTYNCFELIIVDDNSNKDLFKGDLFKDERIVLLKNDKNCGPSFSRNRALKIARGQYIAIMDSDDISLPNRLEEQVKFLQEHSNVVVAGTWFQYFGEKNNVIKREIDDNEYYRCCLLFGNIPTLLNSSAMIRKSAIDDNNISYDEDLRFGEDYKMWVELSQCGVITNIKQVLVKYRVHDKQVTYNNSIQRQKLKYDSKIKIMQLRKIGNAFTDKEKDIFVSYYKDKTVKSADYYRLLQKISFENKNSHFLDQINLEKRIKEQWVNKIMSVNNPLSLLAIQIRIPKESGHIFAIKWKQFINKFRGKKA